MNLGKLPRRTAAHVLLALLLSANPWLVSDAVVAGEKSPELELEKIDDPPGKVAARDNPLARSPQLTVVFGPYQSIQVNVDALGQNIVGDAANEPSIAVNPTNPLNMVIGWRQFDTVASNFRTAGWAYTLNGGQTWTFPGVLQAGSLPERSRARRRSAGELLLPESQERLPGGRLQIDERRRELASLRSRSSGETRTGWRSIGAGERAAARSTASGSASAARAAARTS